jgi:acetamidase/formamidase
MTIHVIEPERSTLHGHFSRELPPVISIESGDTVRFRTLDAGWQIEPHTSATQLGKKFEPRIEGKDEGHALCGPVYIRGAEPGMTLAVRIDVVRPGTWGWTWAGGWSSAVNERLNLEDGDSHLLMWTLDPDAMVGRTQYGHTIDIRPFMGVMGMPPNEPGIHPTRPPRVWGGNIDCKELVAGSTLFLPIPVEGALFSVGDGHAAQGDGEVCGQAIECPMERVELSFDLLPDLHLTTPRAKTAAGWLTFGFHEDVDKAIGVALDAMLDLISDQFGAHRKDALALASVAVDLRVTQIVNGTCGVHAVLPHDALR